MSPERMTLPDEDAAGELAAAVYRDVRQRMPFVPAFLRALAAVDDTALEEAWLQARALYDHPRTAESAARLVDAARADLDYAPSSDVRSAVAPFVGELPTLLLVIASLALTLDGSIEARPAPPADFPASGPLPDPVPEHRGDDPLFEDVSRVYGTTYVPSMYKALAAAGVLEEPWRAIGPYLDSGRGRKHASRVRDAAEVEALLYPDVAVLTSEKAEPVLAQFRRALPRNLVFAVAASGGE